MSTYMVYNKRKTEEKTMIAKVHPIEKIIKMCRPNELKIILISPKPVENIPSEYMFYGQAITNGKLALAVLRDVCDEVGRRKKNGLVLPRLIVSIDDVRSLSAIAPDGEVSYLLRLLNKHGEDCGVELVTNVA